MRVGKKLFPYPIIHNNKLANCYKQAMFSLEFEEQEDNEFLIFKNAHISLNSTALLELLSQNKAEAVLIVECSSTVFRKTYSLSLIPQDIKVPLEHLREKVIISSFIYAKEIIDNYADKDFLDDYQGYSFTIEKFDILAADDGFTARIDYEENEDKKISSIFSIIESSDNTLKYMKLVDDARKIKIHLPTKQYNIYFNMKKNNLYQNIFFAIIAIPALQHKIQELQNNDSEIEMNRIDYPWFNSVITAYEKNYNRTLTDDEFKELNAFQLAQELLNYGSINAIEDVSNLLFGSNAGGDDDE